MRRLKLILVVAGIWLGCVVSGLFVGGVVGLLAGLLDIPHPDGLGDGLGIICACAGGAFLGMIVGGFAANKATTFFCTRLSPILLNTYSDKGVWTPPPKKDEALMMSSNFLNLTAYNE